MVTKCPFCGKSGLERSLIRDGHTVPRCVDCHAKVQLNPKLEKEGEVEVYESGEFLRRSSECLGSEPDCKNLDEYRPYMVGDSLLEIGPGSGRSLAAAKDIMVPRRWNRVESRA
jgi:hypothetical protein